MILQKDDNSQIVSGQNFDDIRKEFSIDPITGEGFVTRRGLGRLCGVTEGAIRSLLKRIKGAYQNAPKTAESVTQQGIEGAYLSPTIGGKADSISHGNKNPSKNPESLAHQSFDSGNQYSIAQGKQKLSKSLKKYAGQDFTGGKQIPDPVASAIIRHYDRKGNEVAQNTSEVLENIGLRFFIQQTLGWKPKPTKQDIIAVCCLPEATVWELRFTKEFYQEMSRLTGLKQTGNSRPALWGALTYLWVYKYLPEGVYEEIKAWQQATDPNKKLHQFLSPEGVNVLKAQINLVMPIMKASSHWREVSRLVKQAVTGSHQTSLFY